MNKKIYFILSIFPIISYGNCDSVLTDCYNQSYISGMTKDILNGEYSFGLHNNSPQGIEDYLFSLSDVYSDIQFHNKSKKITLEVVDSLTSTLKSTINKAFEGNKKALKGNNIRGMAKKFSLDVALNLAEKGIKAGASAGYDYTFIDDLDINYQNILSKAIERNQITYDNFKHLSIDDIRSKMNEIVKLQDVVSSHGDQIDLEKVKSAKQQLEDMLILEIFEKARESETAFNQVKEINKPLDEIRNDFSKLNAQINDSLTALLQIEKDYSSIANSFKNFQKILNTGVNRNTFLLLNQLSPEEKLYLNQKYMQKTNGQRLISKEEEIDLEEKSKRVKRIEYMQNLNSFIGIAAKLKWISAHDAKVASQAVMATIAISKLYINPNDINSWVNLASSLLGNNEESNWKALFERLDIIIDNQSIMVSNQENILKNQAHILNTLSDIIKSQNTIIDLVIGSEYRLSEKLKQLAEQNFQLQSMIHASSKLIVNKLVEQNNKLDEIKLLSYANLRLSAANYSRKFKNCTKIENILLKHSSHYYQDFTNAKNIYGDDAYRDCLNGINLHFSKDNETYFDSMFHATSSLVSNEQKNYFKNYNNLLKLIERYYPKIGNYKSLKDLFEKSLTKKESLKEKMQNYTDQYEQYFMQVMTIPLNPVSVYRGSNTLFTLLPGIKQENSIHESVLIDSLEYTSKLLQIQLAQLNLYYSDIGLKTLEHIIFETDNLDDIEVAVNIINNDIYIQHNFSKILIERFFSKFDKNPAFFLKKLVKVSYGDEKRIKDNFKIDNVTFERFSIKNFNDTKSHFLNLHFPNNITLRIASESYIQKDLKGFVMPVLYNQLADNLYRYSEHLSLYEFQKSKDSFSKNELEYIKNFLVGEIRYIYRNSKTNSKLVF